jgi:hypothetical protein
VAGLPPATWIVGLGAADNSTRDDGGGKGNARGSASKPGGERSSCAGPGRVKSFGLAPLATYHAAVAPPAIPADDVRHGLLASYRSSARDGAHPDGAPLPREQVHRGWIQTSFQELSGVTISYIRS